MQLTSFAALVAIALSLGVQAVPNSFDRAILKDTLKRSYSHGIDMSGMSKRGVNLIARKRGINNHHIGKRCVKKPNTAPVSVSVEPQTTPPSSSPAPSSTPQPSNNNSNNNNNNNNNNSGSAPDADAQEWLNSHNTARAKYGAAPLTWSTKLADAAQSWGSRCVFEHSGGSLGPYGENLAAQTGSMTPAEATQMWMDEAGDYNHDKPEPSHFTQVVWKGSTELGCAIVTCDAPQIFTNSPGITGKAQYGICEYSPAGNVIGNFAANVQA